MEISPKTKMVGLIGHPVEHSLSPVLHNRIYRSLGLDMTYLAFDIKEAELSHAVKGLNALGFIGYNVTIPYKEKILPFLDEMDDAAAAIGAVNTVKIEGDKLIGFNTDGEGFLDSLARRGLYCRGSRIVLLGAGGAARAIGVYLAKEGPKEISIYNRTPSRAEELAKVINRFAGVGIAHASISILEKADFIINTTSLGMWPNVEGNPLEGYPIHPSTVVCDIVYNPPTTKMLESAQRRGCITIGGKDMLIAQGVRAVEIWIGRKVNRKNIWDMI